MGPLACGSSKDGFYELEPEIGMLHDRDGIHVNTVAPSQMMIPTAMRLLPAGMRAAAVPDRSASKARRGTWPRLSLSLPPMRRAS